MSPLLGNTPWSRPSLKAETAITLITTVPHHCCQFSPKSWKKNFAQQLGAFLENNQILSKTQHGFRPQFSKEIALITHTNKLYSNMNNKKLPLLTLLDLSKAFDSVHHFTLLEKLT